jgi:two-component system chemotaxis sensor kinase CheA
MTNSSDADLLSIFWTEVSDYLHTLNNSLLHLETGTAKDEHELLREMNRVAHSMKGAARAVGIHVIEKIGHYMEDVFDAALNEKLPLTPATCDLLYDSLDLIQNVINGVENSTETLASVLARLEQTVAGAAPSPPTFTPPTPATPKPDGKRTTGARTVPGSMELRETGTLLLRPAEEQVRVPVSKLDRLMSEASELLVTRMHGEERQRELGRLQKLSQRWQREWRSVRTAYIRLARRLQRQENEGGPTAGETDGGELVELFKFLEINQRHLLDINRQLALLAQGMAQYNAQLGMLTEQLQDDISAMRLVPFETVLAGFQRMVRDLARDTGKNIHLDVRGSTVELDKTALEVLKEPIMHLLRNAVDHGIEMPAERERQAKPSAGRIELSVEQRGKEIVVRVSDDGRGLDAFRIGRAAVQVGLLTGLEAASLSADDAHSLIFHPGLSTSDQLTTLSGRGMGMDIVRTRVESLRGRITVHSAPSQGTTFSLIIPLSLTRMSCIILRVGGQDFAAPSAAVVRMLKLKRDELFTAEGREMVLIQDQPMPVIPLHSILDLPAPAEPPDEFTALVLKAGDRAIAFVVDSLLSERELVLKPLGREIEGTAYISGAAILGTGDVILVLDTNDLLRASGAAYLSARATPRSAEVTAPTERRLRVLIVDDSITTRTLEKHVLETAGFAVRAAVDGAEAWNMLGEEQFDVVVADVEMPHMNGLELTRRIKENGHTRSLPVILLTSLSKPEQREAGLQAGADAYLVKSQFDQNELLRMIRTLG